MCGHVSHVWLCMDLHVCVWSSQVLYGHVWLFMVMYDFFGHVQFRWENIRKIGHKGKIDNLRKIGKLENIQGVS